jgi:putative flippase GtrA
MTNPWVRGRPVAFTVVGAIAAVVHWAVAVLVVERVGIAPAFANIIGWLTALTVSFLGHWRWTFGDRRAPAGRSALRFFAVSATAFACNAAAYWMLLRFSPVRYDIGLAIVLVLVATFTYLASRQWAFGPR